ncbi:hypothetical protein F5Y16DRAFT_56900 [Xylariaceae sp. FL0255]|nr:hypothetical protein F5Y16DRAFT_56900 [Xylariaceae sp. FL0255]
MLRFRPPPSALATVLLAAVAVAVPYPRDDLRDNGFGYLMDQQCSEYCGAENELCCSNEESCHTTSGVAACTGATTTTQLLAARDYSLYTTTFTETFTSTISSWYVPTTTVGVGTNGQDCVPPPGSGEIACGPICCASWQYCAYSGQCVANSGYSTYTMYTTTGTTTNLVTTQFIPPDRPTSSGATATQTTSTTTTGTVASETNTATSTVVPAGTSHGLSPGAIAGIVIGTIAGIILLLLLCFCCILRGLWDIFLGIFGLGKNRKKRDSERVEIIEEHYSRHGSAAGRPAHRTWFGGGGGGRPASSAPRKEKKSGSGLGWLIAGAGAAAILLGLRRGDKKKQGSRPSGSQWSESYYTGSYTATSPSSFSSDRRTRQSRRSAGTRHSGRSRHSRGTRASRASRPSRA